MEEHLLYNLEAEKSYLGILLIEPGLIKDGKIKPFQLSPGKNFNVLWTIQDLDEKGIPIDFVSVMERVGRKNIDKIGGPDYLGDLAASVPSIASFT
ncbi:DnaB-like helicase N-terminal domain-containing protein, partial [Peribacillus sp. CSMR9]|uniref:DnaB-like helicase N-terminal domain-containing protein n=1 Tax=Peribacillus sp. CSMR9 TaxID=2981350 RepID=UPI0029552B07